jgi:hypothetical protein
MNRGRIQIQAGDAPADTSAKPSRRCEWRARATKIKRSAKLAPALADAHEQRRSKYCLAEWLETIEQEIKRHKLRRVRLFFGKSIDHSVHVLI